MGTYHGGELSPSPLGGGVGFVCVVGVGFLSLINKSGMEHIMVVGLSPSPCEGRVGLVWLGLESLEMNLVI